MPLAENLAARYMPLRPVSCMAIYRLRSQPATIQRPGWPWPAYRYGMACRTKAGSATGFMKLMKTAGCYRAVAAQKAESLQPAPLQAV